MNIRITNTCNNNCLYCLEQSYRAQSPFLSLEDIFKYGNNELKNEYICFYGGNPLLHPDIVRIISFFGEKYPKSISLLTNTSGLTKPLLDELARSGLTSLGVYFQSLNPVIHTRIVNGGISFSDLLSNIQMIQESGFRQKIIIHINKQNIDGLYQAVYFLYKKYHITQFEFINYFPFDRPYDAFRDILEYSPLEKRISIYKLFQIIKKLNLQVKFVKFSHEFFGKFGEFYDFQNGILDQIGNEDRERLIVDTPFCYKEKRCSVCFIKDSCIVYENR